MHILTCNQRKITKATLYIHVDLIKKFLTDNKRLLIKEVCIAFHYLSTTPRASNIGTICLSQKMSLLLPRANSLTYVFDCISENESIKNVCTTLTEKNL